MRSLCQAFTKAPNEAERDLRLQTFYRKIHFVAATAGLAGCHRLAQMASGFEALLFELIGKPALLTLPSCALSRRRLIFSPSSSITLAARTRRPLSAQVLVVDDDSLNNRLVVSTAARACLHPRSTDDPWSGCSGSRKPF
jgi:hypothetical protein